MDSDTLSFHTRLTELETKFHMWITAHDAGAKERSEATQIILTKIQNKLDGQNCALHAARLLELDNRLQENNAAVEKKFDLTAIKIKEVVDATDKNFAAFADKMDRHNDRIAFLEKAYWVGMGTMGAITFILHWVK